MRQRAAKWLLLVTLAAPTLFLGCPGTVALEFLDYAMRGAYQAAGQWGSDAFTEFVSNLQSSE